jgi:glycosyltransferase involved in cell wall biosynthesis
MPGEAPLISVVIPAFNAAPFLPQALASILAQSDCRLQIIVVDDASGDGTAPAAAAFAPRGVFCLRRDRRGGPGAARNLASTLATGSHAAFLDADDLWPAGRLQRLFAALDGLAAPGMAFGRVRHFLCPLADAVLLGRLHCPQGRSPGYAADATLMRLDDFRRVGPFEEDVEVGEFVGWFARARDRGLAAVMIDDVVLERRVHGENQTLRHRESFADFAHVLKRVLDRRRAGPAGA